MTVFVLGCSIVVSLLVVFFVFDRCFLLLSFVFRMVAYVRCDFLGVLLLFIV